MKLIITRKVLPLVAVDENREKNSDTLSSFLDTFRQSIRLSTISRFSFSINDYPSKIRCTIVEKKAAFQIISRSFHHTSTFQKGSAIRTGFRWRGGQRRTSETILSWNLDFWRRYCWVRNEQCNNNNGTFLNMKGPFSWCFDHWNRLYCTFHLSLLLSFLLLLLILLSLLSITRDL